jgi:hypothetical protein
MDEFRLNNFRPFLDSMSRRLKQLCLVVLWPAVTKFLDWVLGDAVVSELKKRFHIEGFLGHAFDWIVVHWLAATIATTCVIVVTSALLSIKYYPQVQKEPKTALDERLEKLANLKNVRLVSVRSGEELKAAAEAKKLKDTDPKLYLDIKETPDNTFISTPFVLHNNREGGIAHNVQIAPLKIGYRLLTFPIIPVVLQGHSGESIPSANGATTPFNRHNLFHWIVEDWNAKGTASGTTPMDDSKIQVVVEYEDSTGQKKFQAATELCFNNVKYIVGSRGAWPVHDEKRWKIGAPKFVRVS